MKIGVITDIHSNLEALEAVLLNLKDCDKIVCLGDICNFGADSNACFDLVRNLDNFTMLMGNHESYIISSYHAMPMNDIKDHLLVSYFDYMCKNLEPKHLEYVTSLEKTCSVNIDGRNLTFIHFGWKNSFEIFAVNNLPLNAKDLKETFKNLNANFVFFGHTHMAQDNVIGGVRYVNFGPLGVPYKKDSMTAPYGIIEINNGQVKIERKFAKYNYRMAIEKVYSIEHPYVQTVIKKFFSE